jgi:hypothetical protein
VSSSWGGGEEMVIKAIISTATAGPAKKITFLSRTRHHLY